MNEGGLLLSMIFGAIGSAYLFYGKKQGELTPALAGIGLCAFPWFVSNIWAMVAVGVALVAAPWLIQL
ncbi:MAG: hypothetical protein M1398_08200 [Deltaproteobacteria bacterium]|jgi:hypothetical protein|nr:hypothetical protein [Deltaproteobacteria bacterium]MDA8306177.1 hypothetical protein [Deltaproteobacteria bacterium]